MRLQKTLILVLITFITTFYSQILYAIDDEYTVAVPVLNMREKPDIKSKTKVQLKAGWTVKLIKKGKTDKIGDIEGQWFYVKTSSSDASIKLEDGYPVGWVFSYYLYDGYNEENLEKVTNIKLKNMSFTAPDFGCEDWYDVTVNENGSFFYIKRDYETNTTERVDGHIYKYRAIYIFDKLGLMFYTDKDLNFIIVNIQGPLFNKEQTEGKDAVSCLSDKGFKKIKLLEEPKTEPVKKENPAK